MSSAGSLEIANFICRFGESKVMLDAFTEIVWPAFQPQVFVRETKVASFFVSELTLRSFAKGNNKRSAIVGRFVKDTVLRRTQIFQPDKGLVADSKSLRSSPNSIFVLTLEDHKLFLYGESQFAPSLTEFRSAARSFLRSQYREYLKDLASTIQIEEDVSEQEAMVRARKVLPAPNLEIVELLSKRSLNEVMGLFDVIKSLDIGFHLTNNEIDNSDFFKQIRQKAESANASKTTLKLSNNDGLAKDQVLKQVRAASNGNATVKIVGTDEKGDSLKGNADNLKFSRNIGPLPTNIDKAAAKILDNFWELAAEGEILTAEIDEKAGKKTAKIVQTLNEDNE